jgi:hypothetical protein
MESRFRRSITAVPNVRIRGDKLRRWKPRRKPTTKAKKTKVFCFFFSKKKAFLLVFLPHPCGWFHPMKGRAHAHAAGHDARVERLRAKEGKVFFFEKKKQKTFANLEKYEGATCQLRKLRLSNWTEGRRQPCSRLNAAAGHAAQAKSHDSPGWRRAVPHLGDMPTGGATPVSGKTAPGHGGYRSPRLRVLCEGAREWSNGR